MSTNFKMDPTTDYWCDGHFISARNPGDAALVCLFLYNHDPVTVRRWTDADQKNLDDGED